MNTLVRFTIHFYTFLGMHEEPEWGFSAGISLQNISTYKREWERSLWNRDLEARKLHYDISTMSVLRQKMHLHFSREKNICNFSFNSPSVWLWNNIETPDVDKWQEL